jgi:hypothetical protein
VKYEMFKMTNLVWAEKNEYDELGKKKKDLQCNKEGLIFTKKKLTKII